MRTLKLLRIFLTSALALCAQNTAKFPLTVPTAAQMGVASNRAETTLTAGVNSSATSLPVTSSSAFKAGSYVTIDSEQIAVCGIADGTHLTVGVSACPNVDGRGIDTVNGGGAAASHLSAAKVQGRIVAWHQNQAAAEVIAIATKLHSELINVADYGAKCDGTTNDLAAFTAAIAAAPSTGAEIQFNGNCYLEGTGAQLILINKPISLVGKGISAKLSFYGSDTTDLIRVYSPVAASVYNMMGQRLANFSIEPLNGSHGTAVYPGSGRHAINLDATDNDIWQMTIENIRWLTGTKTGWGIYLTDPSSVNGGLYTSRILGNTIYGGISLNKSGDSLWIQNNVITGLNGIYVRQVTGAAGLLILGNNITAVAGILIDAATRPYIAYNELENNVNNTTGAMIYLRGNDGTNVSQINVPVMEHNSINADTHSQGNVYGIKLGDGTGQVFGAIIRDNPAQLSTGAYAVWLTATAWNTTFTPAAFYNLGGSLAAPSTILRDEGFPAQSNTVSGYQAGQSMFETVAGQENVLTGTQAGYTLTGGLRNVAIGPRAMYTNATANDLIAIGPDALKVHTTNDSVIAIGKSALIADVSAQQTVGIGSLSLAANTTGWYHTCVGYSSCNANTTANYQTGFGYFALSKATGTSNAGFGPLAGWNLTTGTNNTFAGASTGADITTGSSNTILGSNITAGAAGSSFRTVIGSGAIGTTDNTVMLGRSADTVILPGLGRLVGIGFASLGTPANGTFVYCTDCASPSNACTGSSTGALAMRQNGAWKCF